MIEVTNYESFNKEFFTELITTVENLKLRKTPITNKPIKLKNKLEIEMMRNAEMEAFTIIQENPTSFDPSIFDLQLTAFTVYLNELKHNRFVSIQTVTAEHAKDYRKLLIDMGVKRAEYTLLKFMNIEDDLKKHPEYKKFESKWKLFKGVILLHDSIMFRQMLLVVKHFYGI